MIILGVRSVKLAQLQMPGDLRRRLETANVADLTEGLKRWERFIHDPLIRESDMRIICGRDRLAAAQKAERASIEVKLCDCTDDEAAELELVENIHRRRDPQEESDMRQAYLALMEKRAAEEQATSPTAGRPTTPRGKARAELASKLGISKRAVEIQDKAVNEKQRSVQLTKGLRELPAASGGWGEDDAEAELPPPVELLGTEPAEEFLAGVHEVQELLDEADQQLRQVQATLTKLQKAALALPEGRWQRLYRGAHALAHDVRAARPVSVCPYCKLVPSLQQACTACGLNGYIVEDQTASVPKELLDVGAHLVAYRGRFLPIEKVTEKAEKWSETRGGKKQIQVLGEDGKPLEVDGG